MAEVEFSKDGAVGVILLNRPKALNAVNTAIVAAMLDQLLQWEQDSSVQAVVIEGAGPKAFCAGGDIRALFDACQNKDAAFIDEFYRTEYRLNYKIATYKKPYIAYMDGITMGGGVGVSVHGSHRVVTEATMFAMPETAIGFFPDVGGSYFLGKCPGHTGVYLGLTGARAKAADLKQMGIATHHISNESWPYIRDELAKTEFGSDPHGTVERILNGYVKQPVASPLLANKLHIDRCFGFDRLEDILFTLEHEGGEFAAKTLEMLNSHSPLALKVGLEQLKRGRHMDVGAALKMEFHLAMNMLRMADFREGVRAMIIDKDKNPNWKPARVASVTPDKMDALFGPSGHKDLEFA